MRSVATLTEKEGGRKWNACLFSAAEEYQRRYAPGGTHWIATALRASQ
jgi:hypothetical protein